MASLRTLGLLLGLALGLTLGLALGLTFGAAPGLTFAASASHLPCAKSLRATPNCRETHSWRAFATPFDLPKRLQSLAEGLEEVEMVRAIQHLHLFGPGPP